MTISKLGYYDQLAAQFIYCVQCTQSWIREPGSILPKPTGLCLFSWVMTMRMLFSQMASLLKCGRKTKSSNLQHFPRIFLCHSLAAAPSTWRRIQQPAVTASLFSLPETNLEEREVRLSPWLVSASLSSGAQKPPRSISEPGNPPRLLKFI